MKSHVAVIVLLPLILSFSSVFGMQKEVILNRDRPDLSENKFNPNYHNLQNDENPLHVLPLSEDHHSYSEKNSSDEEDN